jgi:hypothetical protein
MTPHEERATAADYCTRLDQAKFDWSKDFHDGPDEIIYCGYYYLLDEGEREFASRVMAGLQQFAEDHFLYCASLKFERGSDAEGHWMILRMSNRGEPTEGLHLP